MNSGIFRATDKVHGTDRRRRRKESLNNSLFVALNPPIRDSLRRLLHGFGWEIVRSLVGL